MIQQSPTEERARAILAKHTRGKDNIAAVENGGSCYHPTSEVVAAMIEFASQAAQPAEPDGYQKAFYALAELLAIPAQPRSPKDVWENDMLPALRSLIALKQATPNASTSTAGEVADAEANLRDFASVMVDEVIARTRVQLDAGQGLSVEDQRHMLDQLIAERKRLSLATPPAPNDDLRAAE